MRGIRLRFGPSEACRAIHIMGIATRNIGFKRGDFASRSLRSALLTELILEVLIVSFDMSLHSSSFVESLTWQEAASLGLYSADTWIVNLWKRGQLLAEPSIVLLAA